MTDFSKHYIVLIFKVCQLIFKINHYLDNFILKYYLQVYYYELVCEHFTSIRIRLQCVTSMESKTRLVSAQFLGPGMQSPIHSLQNSKGKVHQWNCLCLKGQNETLYSPEYFAHSKVSSKGNLLAINYLVASHSTSQVSPGNGISFSLEVVVC